MQTVDALLALIPDYGYSCVGHFILPEAAWWHYYQPLSECLARLRSQLPVNPDDLATLDAEQQEIEYYHQYHDWYGYAYFILQNVNPS
ncbi:hypothetical protein [Trichothermofontia sp.]